MNVRIHLFILSNKVCWLGVLVALMTSACVPYPDTRATAAQAMSARSSLAQGLATLNQFESDLTSLYARFAQLPVVKQLLISAATPRTNPIYRSQLKTKLGTYTENTAGDFDFAPGGESIQVLYRNGIDLSVHTLEYMGLLAKLNSYQIEIQANQRALSTPAALQVDLSLAVKRFDAQALAVYPLVTSNRDIKGALRFVNGAGARVDFGVQANRYVVQRNNPERVSKLVEDARIRLTDLNDTSPKPRFWQLDERAVIGTVTKNYKDQATLLNVTLYAFQQHRQTDGSVPFHFDLDYDGSGVSNNAFSASDFASYEGKLAAKIIGGPYACSPNDAANVGSGAAMQLEWVDGNVQGLFPGQLFSCSRLAPFL